MHSHDSNTPLTERKVVRRGLLTGFSALGAAALLKLGGASKAEAGVDGDIAINNTVQTSTSETRLTANPAFDAPALQVLNGGTPLGTGVGSRAAVAGSTNIGYGVYGNSSGNVGVYGVSSDLFGVNGHSTNGTGVYGTSNAAGAPASGVSGFSTNAYGVSGYSTHYYAVYGVSSSSKGVFGQSTSGDGVHGSSNGGVGLRGTSAGFVGLVGISDQSIGLYGYNQAGNVPALVAENLAPSGARIAALFSGDVRVNGNFTVMPGFAKNAAVTMPDGSDAVLYCQESPEPYFEDFGRGQLVGGKARMNLEPEFASIVRREGYMVFPVAEGDCNGLYVVNRDPSGFEVRELKGGTSNVPFTYRIVAKRKDIEGKRLARLDPQVKANIAQMRSAAAVKNHPSVKVPPGGNPLVPLEPIPPLPQPPAPRPER